MSTPNRPVALITGASRGIGEAIARTLARRGYALVLAARSQEALHALAEQLRPAGVPVLVVPTDLSDPAQVRQLAREALTHYGRVDLLINNAGVGGNLAVVAQLQDADVDQLLSVNLHAPITLTRAILPSMLERRSGTIIFIGSVAGHIGIPRSSIYSTSKFGLRGFAASLRREMLSHGVGVTVIAPGFIDTAMTAPWGKLPKAPPHVVADAVVAAIAKRPAEIVVPWFYGVMIWLSERLPTLTDRVLARWR